MAFHALHDVERNMKASEIRNPAILLAFPLILSAGSSVRFKTEQD